MFDSLDAIGQRIDAARFDLGATARRLGGNPEAVLAFVKENIRYEHYNGVLRGAAGTLIARAGSTCDQAVLVQTLLAEGGRRTSIRVGVATAAVNRTLVSLASKTSGSSTEATPRISGDLRVQVDRHFHELTGLGAPVVEPLMTTKAPVPFGRAYCWVETEAAEALDPVLGTPPLEREDSLIFTQAPSSLRHRTDFTVTLQGASGTQVLLARSVNPDELVLSPITLTFLPSGADLVERLQRGGLKSLAEMDSFVPQIKVAGVTHTGKVFNLAGKIVSSEPTPSTGEVLGGPLANMLRGGAQRQAPQDPKTSKVALDSTLRLVLAYQLIAPDGSTRTFTRTLFDAASPESREREAVTPALIQRHDIMIATFAAPAEYVASRLVGHYRKQRPMLEALASVKSGGPQEPKDIELLPLPLLSLLQGQDMAAIALSRSHGGALFRGHPGVVTLRSTFVTREGRLRQVHGIDIVSTGFDALPANAAGKILRAKLGLYSSVVESKLLGRGVAISAVLVSETAARQGARLTVLTSPEEVTRLPVSAAQRAALARDLADGYRVAVYPQVFRIQGRESFAWWRIELATGEMLGMLDEGIGGALQEQMTFKATVAIGAVAGGAASFLICYTQEGVSAGNCVWNAGCGAIIGGVFSAGIFGGVLGYKVLALMAGAMPGTTIGATAGGVLGGAGSVVLDQVLNLCQGPPPIDDYNDNDLDGRPNDEDPNDDCPGCDDANPPPGNRNDDRDPDDDNDDVPDEQDGCPSDSSDSVDTDGNGVCDSHEMLYGEDADNDGVDEPWDDFPQDPTESNDADGDGVGDNRDTHPKDPTQSIDVDRDGIDDQADLDPTRPGPWFPPRDDNFDETPPPVWDHRPSWALPPRPRGGGVVE